MNKQLPIIFIAVIALIAGFFASQLNNDSAPAIAAKFQGVVLPKAKTLHDFILIDNHSNAFTLESLKGKWSLLFVGYTHCPDVCPTTLRLLQQVSIKMAEQSPTMTFISVDPARDSPSILNEYVSYFNEGFIGVTGEPEALKAIAVQLSVFFAKAAGNSGDISQDDYVMNHSSSLMLVNPNGKLQTYISAPHTVENIIAGIRSSQTYFIKNKS